MPTHPPMRDMFRHYVRPTEDEFRTLWQSCYFSFDANALLNIYRFDAAATENFLQTLRALRDRVWITHQAAHEFYRGRISEIEAQLDRFDTVQNATRASLDALDRLRDRRRTLIDLGALEDTLRPAIDGAIARVRAQREQHPDLVANDHLLTELEDVIGAGVGEPYTDERLRSIFAEGKRRYESKIPPGYSDTSGKPEPDRYGDYVIWRQLIDRAAADRRAIVFVTDEESEDWWIRRKGKRGGPRPELREEMRREAAVEFYLYDSERFLQHAREYLGVAVADATIREAADVRHLVRGLRQLRDIEVQDPKGWHPAEHHIKASVQSGFITARALDGRGGFRLYGDDFFFRGTWTEEGTAGGDHGPHEVGTTYAWMGGISGSALATGEARIGKSTYEAVEYSGTLRTWITPTPLPHEASGFVAVDAPFTFALRLSGFRNHDDRFEQRDAIFAAYLAGKGTARLEFECENPVHRGGPPVLALKTTHYNVEPAV
jgi:hypothetical protein